VGVARASEQLTDASAAMVTVADDLEKKAKLEEAAKKKAEAEEESSSEEEEDERIGKLRGFVLGKKKSPAETVAYLRSESLGVENAELGIHFLVEALFDEDEPLAPQISDKKAYLIEACKGDAAMQVAILNAVELYVTESAPNDFKKLVAVLKALYDDDVCEEEAIVKWAGDPKSARKFGVDAETGAAVRKQAKPFIEWLQESDEEDE
jgi:translation initiation factor 5